MNKRMFGVLGLCLLSLTGCGKKSFAPPPENFTGNLKGKLVQSKRASGQKDPDNNPVTDELFYFAVVVTVEKSVIKSISWNKDLPVRYVKSFWTAKTKDTITSESQAFFDTFKEKTLNDFYTSLIMTDGVTSKRPNVNYDKVDFASGQNTSTYKFWSNANVTNRPTFTSEEARDLTRCGRLVEIGMINSIFAAITK